MSKRIVSIAVVAAFALIGGWNIYQNQTSTALPDITLSNVEALALGEGAGRICRWRTGHSSVTGWIAICDEYGVGYDCDCDEVKYY